VVDYRVKSEARAAVGQAEVVTCGSW